MGGRIYGYARESIGKRAATLEEQRQAIVGYLAARGVPFVAERSLFIDNAAGFKQDFRDRPVGRELRRCLRRGDHLVVSSLDRIFHTLRDCSLMLRCWGPVGVTLHVANLRCAVHELTPGATAEALEGMLGAARSEHAAFVVAKSEFGRPVNGSAPYGSRWTRLPGSGRWALVPNQEERALMKELLALHEQGESFDSIRQTLQYQRKLRFYRCRGGERRLVQWSNATLFRLIRAAKRFREQEVQAALADHESALTLTAP
jgi:DNA invertase Pin-like site-specific DNA recombinase